MNAELACELFDRGALRSALHESSSLCFAQPCLALTVNSRIADRVGVVTECVDSVELSALIRDFELRKLSREAHQAGLKFRRHSLRLGFPEPLACGLMWKL